MIYNKRLYNLAKKDGINIDDEESVEKAIKIAKSAMNEYNESYKENMEEAIQYLKIAIFSLKDALEDKAGAYKYKQDIKAMVLNIQKLNIISYLNDFSLNSLKEILEALNELFQMNMVSTKNNKNTTLSKDDINYIDKEGYHITGDSGDIVVSRSSYIAARAKSGIIYGSSYVGSKVVSGISKVLNRKNK